MRARLAAMAASRPEDSPKAAAIRAVLRDAAMRDRLADNVDAWPDLTEDQRQTLAALIARPSEH